jgi:hypothetical protein
MQDEQGLRFMDFCAKTEASIFSHLLLERKSQKLSLCDKLKMLYRQAKTRATATATAAEPNPRQYFCGKQNGGLTKYSRMMWRRPPDPIHIQSLTE